MTKLLVARALMMSATILIAAIADDGVAAELTVNAAINKAGRQRMLTQRIIKAYAQVHLGAVPDISRAELAESVRQLDDQLAELNAWTKDRRVRDALGDLERLWTPFRAIAVKPPGREGLRQLVASDDALLAAAHKVVLVLQDRSGIREGRLVNISGRQRMLSQRLAKFYMLRLAGLETTAMTEEFESAQHEFESALAELAAASENDETIGKELRAVGLQWAWFRTVLTFGGAQSYALIVADASESIVNSMDLVTALYERLPSR